MKRNILNIVFFILVFGSLDISLLAQNINDIKSYSITKKTYFTKPLFEKVFPGVSFYNARMGDGQNRISYDSLGEDWSATNQFTALIKRCNSLEKASIEEIIEAMIKLKYYKIDTSDFQITISKEINKNPKYKDDTTNFNYKVQFISPQSKKELIIYIYFDGRSFIKSASESGPLLDFSDLSTYKDNKSDEVCVEIIYYSDISLEQDGKLARAGA